MICTIHSCEGAGFLKREPEVGGVIGFEWRFVIQPAAYTAATSARLGSGTLYQ